MLFDKGFPHALQMACGFDRGAGRLGALLNCRHLAEAHTRGDGSDQEHTGKGNGQLAHDGQIVEERHGEGLRVGAIPALVEKDG